MSRRFIPSSLAVLALAISVSSALPVLADDPAPVPPAAPPTADAAKTDPAPNGDQPRGEGRPRGEGGPRDGGLPREGGFGALRGQGGEGRGGGFGGMRPDETPEQRQQRMIAPYLEMVPDLSPVQQTHIMAIIDAANAETSAARANTALSDERLRTVTRAIRADIANRVTSALTDEQLVVYNAARAEREATMAAMDKVGSVRPDEDVEQMRERILKGYEPVLEELSVKQKTSIIKILEEAGESSKTVKADTKLTDAQELEALRKIHDGVSTKVLPLLDAEQKVTWKKAHAALRP